MFIIEQKFHSFEELQTFWHKLEQTANIVLSVHRSISLASARKNLRVKRFINDELLYYSLTLVCYHGGKYKNKSTGQRKGSTYKIGCPFRVTVTESDDGKFLTVKALNTEHNHEVKKKIVESHPKRRKLNAEEEPFISNMLKVNVNKWLIQQFIVKNLGKCLALKDLHNLKARISTNGNNDLNRVIEILHKAPAAAHPQFWGKELMDDEVFETLVLTGADVEFHATESGEISGIYFQDEEMQKLFHSFPELILIDATYKLNNLRMPLYVFLAIGPNGESEIVAFYLCIREDVQTLRDMLLCFKRKDCHWSQIRTIFTDKDMTERHVLSEHVPQASLLLCLFHVLRAMSREITTSKMNISQSQRDAAIDLCQSIAYSDTDDLPLCHFEVFRKSLI